MLKDMLKREKINLKKKQQINFKANAILLKTQRQTDAKAVGFHLQWLQCTLLSFKISMTNNLFVFLVNRFYKSAWHNH